MSRKNREIEVLETPVKVARIEEEDFISLTDIARHRDTDRTDDLVRNWIRNRNRSNSWASGSSFTTRISIPSNSTGLEGKRA